MEAALADYVKLIQSGTKLVEADWSKVRGLEFREALGHRDELAGQLGFIEVAEEDFVTLVRLRLLSTSSGCSRVLTRSVRETISIRAFMSKESWRTRLPGQSTRLCAFS
jgi:hypothetical protein